MPGDDDGESGDVRDELFERLGDVELVRRLRKGGCAGPDWIVVRGILTVYSIRVLHTMVLNGTLNRRTARLGRPLGLTRAEFDELREHRDERETVVDDAVATGLRVFRDKGVVDGGWRPDGNASLRTYAVNGCLMQVGDAVKRWRRQRSDAECRGAGAELDDDPAFGLARPDVADEVVDRLDARRRVEELLRGVGEPLRSAIVLRLVSDGTRSWKDIAVELDVSERKIENDLRGLRQDRNGRGIGRDEEIDRDQ